MAKNQTNISIFTIVIVTGISLGLVIGELFSGDEIFSNLDKFENVLELTNNYYIEDVDTQNLVEAAINGMLSKLDPHSVYIPSSQMQSVEESFRGDFEGIGIEFQIIDDTLVVFSSISGGPSEALGILPGDKIVEVEGSDIIGVTNDVIRKKLRGKAGTKVNVSIVRKGSREVINYEIIRQKIPLLSVDTKIMIDDKTGYISLSRFSEKTFDELKSSLHELKSKGMKQVVLDLRSNPGGYLNQAYKVADLFIDGNKKIVYTKGRRDEFNEEYLAKESSEFEKLPIIILVNKGSASASEIVAGAIQDWDRGLIIGETTFGKGLVQRQFELNDKSSLRLTISKYFTPSGRSIQRDYKNKNNKQDYFTEREIDTLNVDELNNKPEYKTNKGRIVYGGGGITPDFIIKNDKPSELMRDILKKNLLNKFVLNYIQENIGLEFDNLLVYKNNFYFSNSDLNNFRNYLVLNKINFTDSNFNNDKEEITTKLKAYLAKYFWKNEGWYSVSIAKDKQVQKALSMFSESKNLANLK